MGIAISIGIDRRRPERVALCGASARRSKASDSPAIRSGCARHPDRKRAAPMGERAATRPTMNERASGWAKVCCQNKELASSALPISLRAIGAMRSFNGRGRTKQNCQLG